jgi:hypothetical protein
MVSQAYKNQFQGALNVPPPPPMLTIVLQN